jgi:hypothetical protein
LPAAGRSIGTIVVSVTASAAIAIGARFVR